MRIEWSPEFAECQLNTVLARRILNRGEPNHFSFSIPQAPFFFAKRKQLRFAIINDQFSFSLARTVLARGRNA